MGYRVGDQCYEDPVEASQVFCGVFGGPTSGGFMRCSWSDWDGSGVTVGVELITPDANSTGWSHYVELSACTPPEPFAFLHFTAEDGFVLSAAVIGVWAVAFAIRALVRVLDVGDTQSSE